MQTPNTRRILVSVREASIRLGISETEIRRQIKAGKIEAEKLERPQGTLLRVVFNDLADTPPQAEQPPSTSQETPPVALMSVLEDLTRSHERLYEAYQEIAALRERVGRAEADANHATTRADSLSLEVVALTSRVETLSLEIAAKTLEMTTQASENESLRARLAAAEADLAAERERRPWYRRILGM
jgi:hypothetical protein